MPIKYISILYVVMASYSLVRYRFILSLSMILEWALSCPFLASLLSVMKSALLSMVALMVVPRYSLRMSSTWLTKATNEYISFRKMCRFWTASGSRQDRN